MPQVSLAQLGSFLMGFGVAFSAGALVRILWGMRLNLFFINRDFMGTYGGAAAGMTPTKEMYDQSIIPITTEYKKNSLWRSVFKGNWREDVDLTLSDYQDRTYSFRVGFHLWNRFFFQLKDGPDDGSCKLNGRPLKMGIRYSLRTGQKVDLGDRSFFILVTASPMSPDLHRELYEPISSSTLRI